MRNIHNIAVFVVLGLTFTCKFGFAASATYRLPSSQGDSKNLVVFVHGVLGDSIRTWRREGVAQGWPDMLASDNAMPPTDALVIGYHSQPIQEASNIEEIAVRLSSQLIDDGYLGSYDRIYFVAHSMGGLIVKRALSQIRNGSPGAFRRIRGVTFISTPSQGVGVAKIASWMSQNPQFGDMRPADFNTLLQAYDNDWRALLSARSADYQFPKSSCAYETLSTKGIRIVPRSASEGGCDGPQVPFDRNHDDIVKPLSENDDVYRFVRARIKQAFQPVIRKACNDSPGVDDSVAITRVAHFAGGCYPTGKRLSARYTDTLLFANPISCYKVQLKRDRSAGQEVELTYRMNGTKILPPVIWEGEFNKTQVAQVDVPVNGTSIELEYSWVQQPSPPFGLGVISSLPLKSFHATAYLPKGKGISGFDRSTNEAKELSESAARICSLTGKNPAVLKCDGPNLRPANKILAVPWSWDLFKGC